MDENPSRVARNRDGSNSKRKKMKDRRRYNGDSDSDGVEEEVEDRVINCSSNYCKSCTAGLIADCVALCCCPCAVVNFFALAFFKLPYILGRKCLGIGKNKKKKNLELKTKCCRKSFSCSSSDCGGGGGGCGELNTVEDDGMLEMILNSGGGNARSEAERVWLELYQVGHLGFGRVSFTEGDVRDRDIST
ncbi:hypothetical protein ACFE04_006497 [Oxalis oulophora]